MGRKEHKQGILKNYLDFETKCWYVCVGGDNMAARRPNGEGTVRYRERDSRWEGRIIIGHKADGKAIYKSVFGKTQKEVTAKLRALLSEYEGVEINESQNKTISEWLDIWFNEVIYSTLKPTTRYAYQKSIGKIKKHIGGKL